MKHHFTTDDQVVRFEFQFSSKYYLGGVFAPSYVVGFVKFLCLDKRTGPTLTGRFWLVDKVAGIREPVMNQGQNGQAPLKSLAAWQASSRICAEPPPIRAGLLDQTPNTVYAQGLLATTLVSCPIFGTVPQAETRALSGQLTPAGSTATGLG